MVCLPLQSRPGEVLGIPWIRGYESPASARPVSVRTLALYVSRQECVADATLARESLAPKGDTQYPIEGRCELARRQWLLQDLARASFPGPPSDRRAEVAAHEQYGDRRP